MKYTRKKFNQKLNAMSECSFNCPGCGSSNTSGDASSWICHNCGAQGQS